MNLLRESSLTRSKWEDFVFSIYCRVNSNRRFFVEKNHHDVKIFL